MMPKPSTLRRLNLAEYINRYGDEMVQKCSTCVKHKRVCKVHIKSGRCGECNRRNQRCDVRVTQSEFRRLVEEKDKLRRGIDAAREAQDQANRDMEKALEALRTSRAKEQRLRQQMDLLDNRAAEAIAVEERAIEELEQEEASEALLDEAPTEGLALNLSPGTWSALDGYSESFWDDLLDPGAVGVGPS